MALAYRLTAVDLLAAPTAGVDLRLAVEYVDDAAPTEVLVAATFDVPSSDPVSAIRSRVEDHGRQALRARMRLAQLTALIGQLFPLSP